MATGATIFGAAAWMLMTRWPVGRATQFGKINTIGQWGMFWKTREMVLLRTSRTTDTDGGMLRVSFARNDAAYQKAVQLAAQGRSVKVEVDEKLSNFPWVSETSNFVTKIEEAEHNN
jgi:hypothetical protein